MSFARLKFNFLTCIFFLLSCGAQSDVSTTRRNLYGAYSDLIDPKSLTDTDGDGVSDYWDQCPNEVRGSKPANPNESSYTTRLYYWTIGCPSFTISGK